MKSGVQAAEGTRKSVGYFCCVMLSVTFLPPMARWVSAQARNARAQLSAAQAPAASEPILEAFDRAAGCCEGGKTNSARMRIFSDGRMEWDEWSFIAGKWQPLRKTSTATKKEMKAARWAVASLRGLSRYYSLPAGNGNIDNDDWLEITARSPKKTQSVHVQWGNAITEENYASAPSELKTVVCTIQIIRESRTHEKRQDLGWCRSFYVGY